MNILAFNWRDPKNPLAGGAEEYLFNILSIISKDNNKITYFVASFPGSIPKEEGNNYTIIRKGNRFTVYLHAALFYIKNRKKYDVVIDSINTVPFFTPLYVWKNKKIAIIHHIGGWKTIRKELPLIPSIVAYVAEKSIPFFYKKTDIITISNSTKEDLLKKNIDGKHIKIIWSGVKATKKDYNEIKKASVPTVVYIGRVKSSKNIDHLINAFKIVKSRIKNAELIIGGKGDLDCYNILKNLTKENDIDGVHFLGELSEEDKVKYLESAWVFVYPSSKEGWGISVIEANSCGTPVIGYDV
ncbi:MAG: glycosyltransferase family 4 protein, partial [Thermoplasmata archaeon]